MTPSLFVYRTAVSEDIEEILPLYETLFDQEEDFSYSPRLQQEGLQLLLTDDDSVIYVAEHNGGIIGMCNMQIYISTASGGYAGIIEDVVVHERFRGLGVGSSLLEQCEKFAKGRGLKRLHLLMDSNNRIARLFYSRNNWRNTQLSCLQKYIYE